MYRYTRINRITAWLALIAVAMLFIAPVISTSIARHSDCHQTHGTPSVAMHDGHQDSARCEHVRPMEHMTTAHKAMSPMEEMACGYCQLLLHLPFVQFTLVFLLWLLLLFVIDAPVIQQLRAALFHPWSPQRARAPPYLTTSAL